MNKGRIRTGLKAGAILLTLTLFGVALPLISNAGGASAAGPCGPPVVSVIACENTANGDPQSDWLVAGAGDQTLQGFPTSMSVNVGQTVSFKISSTQAAYHIDILRLGYYQGTGAHKLITITPSAPFPQTQPACLTKATTGLIDCGNWAVSASWAVPSTAVSGVYIAHLIRNDTGGGADVPFVVRNDASHSDMLFQTSDETWQAYNTYGGNSLYTCTVACPPGNPAAYKAAYAVSYNRPFHTPADDMGRSWLTYAELPMLKFLEANGYDVSYIAGTDVDTSGALLLNHKMFMSTGHDEYWSGNQRANVVAARDHGVNLAFFSGNEVFWKTQFGPSTDGSNTPERTLTTYKDTHFDSPQNPSYPPIWTGTWEDPRFTPPGDGGNPSNALTGQKFLVNSGTTDIKVPAAYAQLRLWRNTPVASLAAGQSITLGAGLGTLGYEWDADTDNGFRPAGLFDLSSTTSTSAEIFTDYGSTTQQGGTATHNLTMYKAPSGALVFGAGTVQWAWGLDNTWTGAGTDRTMQQATVNLFADMGAQPFSLISGLVSASPSLDTTAPTSHVTSPAPGANLTDSSSVTIQGTASDSGGGVVAGVEVSTDSGTTWHPANGTTNWSYTWSAHGSPSAVVKSRAVDDSGNLESPSAGTTVSVACPCSLFGTSVAPTTADGADPNSIEVGVKFTSDRFGTISGIRFYKSTANTGTHVGNLWTAGGQLLASASFSGETASGWQQVNFSTPVPITPNTTYVASYFAPKGHYANDNNYLYRLPQSPNLKLPVHDSPPLHVLLQTPGNPNGVYNYGTSSGFPQSADLGTNYWVDVVFTPQAAPGTPTNVVATGGYTSAGLTWTAPSTGGSVTTYTVTPFIGSSAQAPTQITGNPAPTAGTVTGLTNGTTYTFTVAAANPTGPGGTSAPSNAATPSASASVVIDSGFENGLGPWTPTGNPSPSVSTTRAHTGTSSAFLGALDPAPDAAGDSSLAQTVTVPTGSTSLSFWYWTHSTDTLCTSVADCTNDWNEAQIRDTQGHTLAQIFRSNTNAQAWTQWTFDTTPYAGQTIVLWFNVHGDGSATSDNTAMYLDDVTLSVTGPPAAPAAPTGVTATPGSGSATVTWVAPGNGGSPITAYTVTPFIGTTAQNPVQVSGSPPATSIVITGLTPNTAYTFKVAATNAVGTGPPSAASSAVTVGADTVPAAPTNVVAVPGNTTANVSWTAPFNGGSTITSYTVTGFPQSETGGGQVSTTVTGSPPARSLTVNGLTNGTAYTFSVVAANGVGPSQPSVRSSAVTPGTLPSAPTNVVATGGVASATISWTAAADGGSPITSYTITPYVGTAAQVPTTITGSPPTTTATVALTNGTSYTFTVSAANGVGAGPASAQSNAVMPAATVPGSPSGVTATPADSSATVSWTAPADGGSPITAYTITPFIGSTAQPATTVTGSPPGTSALVSGLTNGTTYTFTVSASNASGTGVPSPASGPVTPAGPPAAPTGVSAVPGNASATISWTAPANGGSPINGYTVTPFIGANAQPGTTVGAAAVSATMGGLTNGTTYTFRVSASNAIGQGPQSTASNPVTPTGALAACPCTIFDPSSTPATVDAGDAGAVNLGVAFTSDTGGYVTGIRFYKSAANGGTHVGTLWSVTGTALASATFSGESSSGWQQVIFANPVLVTAGTTYVASYFAPVGHYSVTTNMFGASGVDSPPLHALANTTTPNGVFAYGSTSAFPTSSFNATNYWVDVVFNTKAPPGAPTGVTGSPGNASATVSWTAPSNSGSSPVTTYTVTPFIGAAAQPATIVSGSPPAVSATVTGLTNGTSYTFQVSASSAAGTGAASAPSSAVTPHLPPPPCPCTIFGSATPATVDSGDNASVVLGVAFNAEVSGFVTGVRFYKASTNTGTHVGALWSASGQLLASATFTGESASGWQQVSFSAPVAVTAGTTYVASYLAPAGHYSFTANAFAAAADSPPLHALANSTTPNGQYLYSSTSAFPTNSFNASNYFVDVVFNQTVQATAPGAPIGVTAMPANASATVSWSAPASGGSPITSYSVTPFIGTAALTTTVVSGSPPATSVVVGGLTNGTSYTFQVAATNAVGTGPASTSGAVTPRAAPTCPCTIFGSATPATIDSGDKGSVVLGVAFTSDTNGFVSGVRFYKSSANTGTHVGALWSAGGQLLASATFTGESASGWQQVSFSSPVAVTAGTRYVASYLAPAGHYSVDAAGFSSAGVDNPPLHALANSTTPNGLYLYSATSAFPTNSFNASNYWVDVVYQQGSVTVPGMPSGVAASPGYPASATISWTPPGNGGSPITSYTITPFIGTAAQPTSSVAGSAVSATVTGLTNDATYTFTVAATNANGTGPASVATNPVTPHATAPACPCSIFGSSAPATVDSADTSSVVLGVAFNSDTAGYITGVRFYKAATNTGTHVGALWSASGQLLVTATFTSESASGWQQATFSTPVAVTVGTTYVASYLAPAGHYSFTGAAFATQVNNAPLHALASSAVPNGNGLYTYSATSVFPTNSFNATNYWVDPVFSATAAPPGAPSGVTATAGNASSLVSWTAPVSGDSPITSYTVTPFVGTAAQTTTIVSGSPPATSVTVPGLANGTTYTFKVTASNAFGPGPASPSSNAVTPAGPPAAPTNVVATAHASSAAVSWTAPSTGGSPLTSYTVTPFIGTTAQTATTVTGSPPATSVTVSGLNAGTTYTFKVSATNAVGTGPQSTASNAVTPCLLLC
ncbi:MAG: large repetitive protein [Actinomycetota bacterium]|nr:large repetitive protein [Actinomycetota bacterium]